MGSSFSALGFYVSFPHTVVGFKCRVYPHLNPILGTATKVLHDAWNDIFYCQNHPLEAKQSRRRGKGNLFPQGLNVVISNSQTHDILLPLQSISLVPSKMLLSFIPEANATYPKFYVTCVCLTPWEATPIANHKAIHTPSLINIYTHIHSSQNHSKKNHLQGLLEVSWWDSLLKTDNFKVGVILLVIFSSWVLTNPGTEIPPPLWASVPMPQNTIFLYLAETVLAATNGHCLQPFCCTPQGTVGLPSQRQQSDSPLVFSL